MLLARADEQRLVRTVWLQSPMLSNEFHKIKFEDKTYNKHIKEETRWKDQMEIFALCASDRGTLMKNEDPLIYPAYMSEEDLAKLPGVIIQTAEYDFMRFEAKAFIPRCVKAGVYLDHADYVRDGHGVGEEDAW